MASNNTKAKQSAKKPGVFSRLATYLKNVRIELHRVTWPTRSELINLTGLVIGTLLFFGLLIWLVDTGVTPLLTAFSGLRP